jgi:hypothetical protein
MSLGYVGYNANQNRVVIWHIGSGLFLKNFLKKVLKMSEKINSEVSNCTEIQI